MLKDKQIDYIILGNHYYETDELHQYFGSPVNEYYLKAYVDHCIKAIDTGLYSYIAHPDLVYYDKDSKLYQEEMSRLCAYAKEKDMPLEFNLLGFMTHRHYPNNAFWKIASHYKNKAIIGFDAHSPDALLKDEIYQAVNALGLKYCNDEVAVEKEIQREWKDLCCVEITIEHLTGKQAIELVK